MIGTTPDNTWQRVSKRTPCRICKGIKGCIVALNGDVVCLRRQSDEPATFGLGGWWHRTDAPSPVDLRDTPAPSTPKPNTASIEARDRVNRRLLELCVLSPAHHAYVATLHQRTDLAALYGSLPPGDAQRPIVDTLRQEFGFDLLCTVPGFIIRNGHLRLNGGGLLIAIYDIEGHLVGFQVRYGPSDYRWLSTSNGPSTGAPYHIARPLALRDHRIYIVESPKTANILADLLGAVVIATAGHNNWKVAREALTRLLDHENAEVAVIAFDADDAEEKATTTALVEQSRQYLAAAARGMGFHVKLARWAHANGKGPDDLLLAGHTWELTVYRATPQASDSEGDNEQGAAPSPGVAGTLRIQREELARARAAYDALRRLLLTEQYSESEKKMLVWLLHEKLGYCFGRPIPETFATVRITDADKPRAGLSINSFDTARKRFVADGVLIVEKRPALEGSPTGRPFDVFTVDGQRLEHLIVGLDANDGAQAKERIARATLRAQEARARHDKMLEERARREEEKARREEQDKIVRQQLAHIGHERRYFAEVTERLSHQLTEKEAEAEAMRHAAAAAQREAQRIIEQARQEQESIACRGCGVLIPIEDWRCDDCRTEGTSADRFTGPEFSLSFVGNGYDDGQHRPAPIPHHLPSTTLIPTKLRENPPQAMGEDLKPCTGGCGTLTHRGWECKPCRERPPRPLHISTSAAPGQEASHGH